MSERNHTDIIADYLKAWNAGEADLIAALLHEDVAYDNFLGERVIGIDLFRLARAKAVERFMPEFGDVVIMTGSDATRAAAEVTLRGRYHAPAAGFPDPSGQGFSVSGGMFLALEGEKISRISEYVNLRELHRQLSDS